jgi:chromosome segregation protein
MKIKKIEISGFKSFCDKAVIEFPPGISAVVGPNGCGKSNIIDALRWAMGEQSVKTLRGKSMEDVIFSGSNGKPPLNMAEVSLTLANDNGSAPEELKDFTEIMLTRRLYRSGESAYLLNKQPCRLKDIHNVFLGSGLGAKSYAVIQQGNIGAITDAGPEDRRFFIEEAAGITRYKSRKMEALRKIDMTNQNLLRVQDIMSEIKRQMSSLKRQARKAEIYNNYQRRIKTLDLQLAFHQFDEYSRQIDETEVLLHQLKDSDVGHSTELKKLDAAVEDVKLKRWQKNQEIANLKSAKFDTQRRLDRMETELSHLREETQRLAQESGDLTGACKNLEQKNADMLSEIAVEERENRRLQAEIDAVKAELEQKRTAHQRISDQVEQLQQSLETDKQHLMELVTREAQYKNIYHAAANNKENLKRRLARVDEEEVLAQRRIAEAQDRESTIRGQLDSLNRQIQELNSRIEALRHRLQERSKALADQVKHVHSLELERNTLRSKYATLKKMEDNFEWYKDGVQAIMKHFTPAQEGPAADGSPHNQTLQGIIGLLADIIDVQTGFETAVEVALGEALQYVLVNDQQSGIRAIDYLQSQQAGRSGFIPVRQLVPDAPSQFDPSRLLISRISVKPQFDSVVRSLIGQVVLADDLQEALDIFNRNGTRQPDFCSGDSSGGQPRQPERHSGEEARSQRSGAPTASDHPSG